MPSLETVMFTSEVFIPGGTVINIYKSENYSCDYCEYVILHV